MHVLGGQSVAFECKLDTGEIPTLKLTTMHVLGGQSVAFAEIDTRL